MSERMEPPIGEHSGPFWDATRERRLEIQRCTECGQFVWYPRVACPGCFAEALEWREVSGRGAVYAVSIQHRAGVPQMKDRVPYAVALVELDEGVRVMSNVVGCAPDDVHVGQRVHATWEPLSDGRNLLLFEPE